MDPMFRQRLCNHHRDLTEQYRSAEVGSRAWHKLDAAIRSNAALYVELFREAIVPVHEAGPRAGTKKPAAPG